MEEEAIARPKMIEFRRHDGELVYIRPNCIDYVQLDYSMVEDRSTRTKRKRYNYYITLAGGAVVLAPYHDNKSDAEHALKRFIEEYFSI